jgi:hypothetical protein
MWIEKIHIKILTLVTEIMIQKSKNKSEAIGTSEVVI